MLFGSRASRLAARRDDPGSAPERALRETFATSFVQAGGNLRELSWCSHVGATMGVSEPQQFLDTFDDLDAPFEVVPDPGEGDIGRLAMCD